MDFEFFWFLTAQVFSQQSQSTVLLLSCWSQAQTGTRNFQNVPHPVLNSPCVYQALKQPYVDGICKCRLSKRHSEYSVSFRKAKLVILHQLSIPTRCSQQIQSAAENPSSQFCQEGKSLKDTSCNKNTRPKKEKIVCSEKCSQGAKCGGEQLGRAVLCLVAPRGAERGWLRQRWCRAACLGTAMWELSVVS